MNLALIGFGIGVLVGIVIGVITVSLCIACGSSRREDEGGTTDGNISTTENNI